MIPGRRVAVTGIGAVTPLGSGTASIREALARGSDAAAPATLFDASAFSSDRAAEVKDFDPRPSFRVPKALKLCDRRTRLAVAAAAAAWDAARLDGAFAAEDVGVVLGTSGSDLGAEELSRAVAGGEGGRPGEDVPHFARRVLAGLSPLWLLLHLPNMAGAHVAIQLGARGPNNTVMSGWASGLAAIGEGAALVARGSAKAVLAGGADSPIHPFAYAGLEQEGRLGPGGLVPGEGAVLVALEAWDDALARGAPVLAEVTGWATGLVLSPEDAERLAAEAGGTPSPGRGAASRVPRLGASGHLFAAQAPLELVLSVEAARAGRESRAVVGLEVGPSGEAASVGMVSVVVPVSETVEPGAAPGREDG